MKRLISDASKMTAEQKKLNVTVKSGDLSFANIANAISVVQEKLGIAGTTSKEASTTIQGSLNSLQSAWGNLLTSLVTGGDDYDQCVKNLVDSVKTFGKNVMPALQGALGGIGAIIDDLAPVIAKEMPTLVEKLLPPLLNAAVKITVSIAEQTPMILKVIGKTLKDNAPILINAAKTVISAVGKAIYEGLTGKEMSGDMFKGLKENISKLTPIIKNAIPIVLGLVGAFKGFKAIASVSSIFGKLKGAGGEGGSGSLFSGITNTLKGLANTDTKTVLKGMANLAIIIGGMTAITAAFMLVAPYISQLSDTGTTLKMIVLVGALGVVGAGLAKLAGIVGNIPVMTVVKGLANIAIIIAGMSALYLLIGAVSLIDFDLARILKITAIIGVLGLVGSALAAFAGAVGLIPIPVVLAGLANIGLALGGMTAIISAFGALGKIKGFNEFIASGGDTLANIFKQIGKIGGALVGGLGEGLSDSLPKIGANIALFGISIRPFFSAIKGVDMGNVGTFFSSLGSFMLKMTGDNLLSKLTGGSNLAEVGTELTNFASNASGFFTKVAKIPEIGFTNAKSFFNVLADIGKIPKTGGLKEWFSGKTDYSGIATGLKSLSGDGIVSFFKTVATLPENGFTNATSLFKSLSNISKLPKSGGLFSKEVDLAGLGADLKKFGEDVKSFITVINGLNLTNLNGLWDSLKRPADISTNTLKVVTKNIDDIVKKITDLPKKMGDGIKSSGKSLSSALVKIWKDAVTATTDPVNKLISGANWILQQFGSNKRVSAWKPYAKGTDGHTGGNALVNDGRGAELVQMPNGNTFIPKGKNVFIPNAPKGMKVLSAEQTANVMGKKSPTFRYADGTGEIDIWSYIDNAKGLISKVKDTYVNYDGMSDLAKNIGQGMVTTISGQMTSWVEKLFDEMGGQSIASYVPSKGVEQWRSTVIRALQMEGLYSEANVKRTLYQMYTESGGNPRAINLWDSNAKRGTPSKGLMQVIDPTFKAYARAGYNTNIYDPLSNILASIRYARARYGSLARAFQGHGYANGGIVSKPTYGVFGEAGTEALIPLSRKKRKQGIGLWNKAGEMLGLSSYSPESTASRYSKSKVQENNTYSPQFNMTISGTNDDRAMARKVKRWINEAIDETFDSYSRRNPKVQES